MINFDCAQLGIYFKCKAVNLNISEEHQNSSFVMGATDQSPKEILIESSTMLFIPPEIFEQFAEVREFIASNVSLKQIRVETFANAYKLHYLILSQNEVEILIDKSFSNASELQSLKLQHNKISFLSSHAFFGLKELRTLILSFNKIVNLPLHVFRDLESLEDLSLDHNLITVISYDQFVRNIELATLNFANNKISSIDNSTFENLSKLERLNLIDNVCINENLAPWRAGNQNRLKCCLKLREEVEKCLSQQVEKVTTDRNHSNHVPLIFILFISIFANFLVISYFILYRRRESNPPENIELITSDVNGSAFQVY